MTNKIKSFRADVLSGTLGTVIAYIISFATLPLITHFYKPEHIGTWQILLGLIALLIPIATLRFEDALILEKSTNIISRLLNVILINTTIIAILLIIVSLLIGGDELILLNLKINQSLLLMATIGVIIQASFLSFNALIVKEKKFKTQAISKIIGAISIPFIALITLVLTDASNRTYIIAALISLLLQSILLFRYTNKTYFKFIFEWDKSKTITAVKKYKVYPTYMVPYALSQGFIWQITLLSLGILFSTSTVGAYTVARQLVFMPVSLLTTGLKQVMFSYASSAPKYDKTVSKRIRFLLINIVDIAVPFAVFSFFYITDIINYVLGEGWDQVGVFSKWILIPAVTIMLTSWLDRMFDVYGKQRLAVFLQIASDILFLLILFICYLLNANAITTVICISLYLAIYNLIWLLVVLSIQNFPTSFWIGLLLRITTLTVFFLSAIKLFEIVFPIQLVLPAQLLLLTGIAYYTYLKTRTNK